MADEILTQEKMDASPEDDIPPFMKKAVLWEKGRDAEDFRIGDQFPHHWGRTINDADNGLFTMLTQMFNPLYFNEPYAQAQGHPTIVVNPLLVFNMVFGMSVEDLSENRGVFVGINECKFHAPVYVGDTLRATSEVIDKRRSKSNAANHILTWRTRGLNQDNKLVMEYVRSNLFIDRFMGD